MINSNYYREKNSYPSWRNNSIKKDTHAHNKGSVCNITWFPRAKAGPSAKPNAPKHVLSVT